MSYIGNASDVEQEKNISDFRHNRGNTKNLGQSAVAKMTEMWNDKRQGDDDTDSEISDSGNFLAKGKI